GYATVAGHHRQLEAVLGRPDRGPDVTKDAIARERLDIDGIALVAAEHHQIAPLVHADDKADVTRGTVSGAAPEDDDAADGRPVEPDAVIEPGAGRCAFRELRKAGLC